MAFDPKTFNREEEVRLRIAGIYYDEVFEYEKLKELIPAVTLRERKPPKSGNPTIFELLEAATINAGPAKKNFV